MNQDNRILLILHPNLPMPRKAIYRARQLARVPGNKLFVLYVLPTLPALAYQLPLLTNEYIRQRHAAKYALKRAKSILRIHANYVRFQEGRLNMEAHHALRKLKPALILGYQPYHPWKSLLKRLLQKEKVLRRLITQSISFPHKWHHKSFSPALYRWHHH